MSNFPFHQRELRRDTRSSRLSAGRRGGPSVQTDTNTPARVHTGTRASQGHNFVFLSKGRARGPAAWHVRSNLLSAVARSPGTVFCRWADARHQAGCRVGREHSLTFVDVVLARRKASPHLLSCPGLSTQARQLLGGCGGGGKSCVWVHGGARGQLR